MLLLHNTVRAYDWGTVDGIAPLVGSAPTGGPEAELWVGTHPGAPSVVAGDPAARTLTQVVAEDPARWLGPALADGGLDQLPFLLKVLAIGKPLSLQAHPTEEQARAGWAREERSGLHLDAPDRIYRDRSPKPEVLVALVPTWALCGFREPADAAELVAGLALPELAPLEATLRRGGPDGLRHAVDWVLRRNGHHPADLTGRVASSVSAVDPGDRNDPRAWVRRLVTEFPGDPACLAPLLLELVRLDPGDAVHLPAGNLHAYLDGAGIEVMAASDNVLRGGLTSKHVDVDALLDVLRIESGVPAAPARKDLGPAVTLYDAGERAFALARIDAAAGPVTIETTGPSLLLATGGEVDLAGPDGGLSVGGGDAAFLSPGAGPVEVSGTGVGWWAMPGDALPG